MFVITLTYLKPIEDIEAATVAHRAWLDQHVASGLILLAGPQVPRTGGIFIARGGQTRDELAATLADDPFLTQGLARYDFVEFNPGKRNPAFDDLI